MSFFSRLFGGSKTEGNANAGFGKLSFLEVDMHNHLLPGIDDGSESVEQSLALIKGVNELGISKFICTPHIMEGVHNNNKVTIGNAHDRLFAALKESEHEGIQIRPAAEHMIDHGLNSIIENKELCVMPGGYVLIEMSYLAESRALFQIIFDIHSHGYKPILAHPERYNYYHPEFNMYKKIKDAGCLLQLNLLSISRYYGVDVKNAAMKMIKSGMYDFAGTDLHHERHLAALQDVVQKYDIRDLLKTCNILNPTLADKM